MTEGAVQQILQIHKLVSDVLYHISLWDCPHKHLIVHFDLLVWSLRGLPSSPLQPCLSLSGPKLGPECGKVQRPGFPPAGSHALLPQPGGGHVTLASGRGDGSREASEGRTGPPQEARGTGHWVWPCRKPLWAVLEPPKTPGEAKAMSSTATCVSRVP